MSKNFGHTFDAADAPPAARRPGAQLTFWATVVAGIIVAPVMGPGALVLFVVAIVVAWVSRPWGG